MSLTKEWIKCEFSSVLPMTFPLMPRAKQARLIKCENSGNAVIYLMMLQKQSD